jgi:hypothetical protein
MSTKDEAHGSRLMGEALLAAQDESLQPLLDRLAAAAEGEDGIRAEVAGILAGDWLAHPEGRQGHELIAAGLVAARRSGRRRPADRSGEGRLRARERLARRLRPQRLTQRETGSAARAPALVDDVVERPLVHSAALADPGR